MTEKRRPFEYFVILASMRTGSNLLEERLSAHPEIEGLGELFNPHFVGKPGQDSALGLSREERTQNPEKMIEAIMSSSDVLAGFRLFDGHDSRVLDHVLQDPRCAKIHLTRSPVESYLSLKAARTTKQWWLGDLKSRRDTTVLFDADEFSQYLRDIEDLRSRVRRGLQRSGQTAYTLDYEDILDGSVVNGIFRFLGASPHKASRQSRSKVQNPAPIMSRVSNPEEMRQGLSGYELFDLERVPDFEATRGAGATGICVSDKLGLMYMPTGSGRDDDVIDWMTMASGRQEPTTGLSQRDLKSWMRSTPGHRAFSVLDHPLPRAFHAFSRKVLGEGEVSDEELVSILRRDFFLPDAIGQNGCDADTLREAFLSFLKYIKASLHGQTGHREHTYWASQTKLLEGYSQIRLPDVVVREPEALAAIVAQKVHRDTPRLEFRPADPRLSGLLSLQIQKVVRSAYRKDFAFLGFQDWRAN